MKKISILIALALLFSLFCSCSAEPTKNESSATSSENAAKPSWDVEIQTEISDDYDENAITVAYIMEDAFPLIIKQYIENVENVNVISFHGNNALETSSLIKTKLMAKDTDIDVFYVLGMDAFTYISALFYEDLSKYDGLKKRFEDSAFASAAASYNGGYVGIPFEGTCQMTTQTSEPTFFKYCIKNISAVEGAIRDESGNEYYRVLKYLDDNADDEQRHSDFYSFGGDEFDDDFYKNDYNTINCNFIMMNPFSEKKEKAAKFLEYVFDIENQAISSDAIIYNLYPSTVPDGEIYRQWDFYPYTLIEPLRNAWCDVRSEDEKPSKRLAKDVVNQVEMRFEG